jgi:8-oxo-dGTP pyrophosphatase MutT (NUDIX family)
MSVQTTETAVTPLLAATLLLLRDGADGLEVLMVVRPDSSRFAAGAIVFPGGKVDESDRALCQYGAPGEGADAQDRILRIAAIRETFEECGILLARSSGTDPRPLGAHTIRDLVPALRSGELVLADDALVRFAHWITPADRSRRFDTHFFLARAPEGQETWHESGEIVDAIWITPQAALADADSRRRRMMNPTYLNLLKLSRHATVADALTAARRATIVTVLPVFAQTDTGPAFIIPEAADYGTTRMPADEFRQP